MDFYDFLMMASIDDSGSPQYLVFQPLLDGLSYRQCDKHLKNILVADLRSAFILIAKLAAEDCHRADAAKHSICNIAESFDSVDDSFWYTIHGLHGDNPG